MSAIDDEIGRFFDHMAGLSWDIEDYSKWMRDYEANRYKYPAWVTKDGRSIPIHELTDEHLANLIPFVERKDPNNETRWAELLKQEQQYRRLSKKVARMKSELKEMRNVSEMCL